MRKLTITAAALLLAAAASAQNLNPTVEVTNVYASSAKDIAKPVQEMAMPDSVTQFNLKLDYSVFDSPYKGAYEFTPGQANYGPEPVAYKEGQFFLKAGVGYALHPELDVVYSPVLWNRLRMNIFARHNSYFGNYRNLEMRTKDAGGREIQNFVWDKTRSKGYDALTTAGFDATFPWEKGEAWLEASYLNLCGKDYLATRVLHGIRVKAGVHSTGLEKFSYDVSLGYGNYQDVKSFRLTENKVDLRSRFGYRMNPVGELYLRADWTFETLRRDISSTASMLWFTPGYRFTYDDWTFDLGAKVDIFIGDVARTRTQIAYPNVFIGYNLLNGDMTLYAKVTGGAGLNAYSDLVLDNHHFTPLYDRAAGSGLLMDTSVERVNASIGVRGHIRNRFQYDVHTGYSFVGNGLLDGLALADPDGNPYPFPMPALGYTKYHLFYADLAGAWISDALKVDARLSIRKTSLKNSPLFAPPLVSGGIGGRYTWLGKITAGLTLDFASSRTAKYAPDKFYRVPGYADLGVYGEYDFNSLVGIWLKAGNLLNMTIQQTPLFTGSGIWFSVGVALSF